VRYGLGVLGVSLDLFLHRAGLRKSARFAPLDGLRAGLTGTAGGGHGG
jgi:hypothetical protein